MFDITTQAVADTAALHLKNAAGEPLYADAERTKPVQIILHSPGSKAFSAVETAQSARAVKRLKANDGEITATTAEERLQQTADDLAMLTVRFENFAYPPAGDAQGAELFKAVYADPKLGFIAKQVSKFLTDWSNFTGK
ncbi:hypothetical protein SAMN03159338_4278 [Sphingomonas sp. NFR04]|uniref:hypothetical protein n=1 Tax=Sphingomonas sp. NFR04 TaxID=1566283 RepID=UPI0008F0D864|nr:hypothetical protein [Sphingomonas sp. NFR04]SFK44661.1 hypothetical protein SAMN03159338_4278 [Sphingomonas sp. NFR04]